MHKLGFTELPFYCLAHDTSRNLPDNNNLSNINTGFSHSQPTHLNQLQQDSKRYNSKLQRTELPESDTPIISRARSYHTATGACGHEDIPPIQKASHSEPLDTPPTQRRSPSEPLRRLSPSKHERTRNTRNIPTKPQKG